MDMTALYQEIILDHYRSPHHAGLREPYDAEVHHVNPTCGDEVTMRVQVCDGVIEDISYDAEGCSISQASTSVLTDLLIGKRVHDAMGVLDSFVELMQSQGQVEPDEDVLEDGIAFAGVAKFPARVKCALLGWMAWKDATAKAVAIHDSAAKDAVHNGTPKATAIHDSAAKARLQDSATKAGTIPDSIATSHERRQR